MGKAEKQKKSFVPKARLIQILGEYLIKDATVGLLELIKNSYDADATAVSIEMYDLNKKTARIIIRDNGVGMDDETFLNKWMNPATGHKEQQKEGKKRSALGRLPLGEKGVGRFATQQIGDNLRMIPKRSLRLRNSLLVLTGRCLKITKKIFPKLTLNTPTKQPLNLRQAHRERNLKSATSSRNGLKPTSSGFPTRSKE